MKVLASTWIVVLAVGAGLVALACRAHVQTAVWADQEGDAGPPEPPPPPAVDSDRDGIPDVRDKCPNEPEVYNGLEDADGCPDVGSVRCCHERETRITTRSRPANGRSGVQLTPLCGPFYLRLQSMFDGSLSIELGLAIKVPILVSFGG
jgi:hypothetical protein